MRVDSTDTSAVIDSDATIAMLAPRSSPRVFDEPVIAMVVILTVANNSDSRVDLCSTFFARNDSPPVIHEERLARSDGNSDWGHRNCNFELFWVVWQHVDVASHSCYTLCFNVLANSVGVPSLRVVLFEHQRVSFSVLEGTRHESTLAAKVLDVAVN